MVLVAIKATFSFSHADFSKSNLVYIKNVAFNYLLFSGPMQFLRSLQQISYRNYFKMSVAILVQQDMLHLFTLLQPGSLVQDLKQTQHSFLEKAPAHYALTQIKIPAHMPSSDTSVKYLQSKCVLWRFPSPLHPPLLLMFLCKAHRIRCSSPTHTLTCHGSQWINYALHFFRNFQSLHPMLSATLIPQNPNTFSSELNLLMVWPAAKRHV